MEVLQSVGDNGFLSYTILRKRMQDAILQAIFENTTKTREAVDALQDSLARIETVTEQNQKEIENLNEIVWKPCGDSIPLVQAHTEQSAQIRALTTALTKVDADLTYTIRKVETELRSDISNLSSKLDSKNAVTVTLLIGLITTMVGGLLGFGSSFLIDRLPAKGR